MKKFASERKREIESMSEKEELRVDLLSLMLIPKKIRIKSSQVSLKDN